MGFRKHTTLLLMMQLSLWLSPAASAGEYYNPWNILHCIVHGATKNDLGMSLKGYCDSWRLNVELNNVRNFDSVPAECTDRVGSYVTSSQYKADVQRAAEEAALFLTESFALAGDGKDAWVFDVDDTLLSDVPYYKKQHYGSLLRCRGVETNRSSLEKWMEEQNAPAVEHVYDLYHDIRGRGLKIFIISARRERLRDATVNNLIKVGYRGWSDLILRCDDDGHSNVKKYKTEERKKLVNRGYRLWGIVGDQWSSILGHPGPKRTFKLRSSILGHPGPKRTFKLPNPMYYVS